MAVDYDNSYWKDPAFSDEFLDNADIYVMERKRMLGLLQSFYLHHYPQGGAVRFVDLGAGDGILAAEILKLNADARATLVDGSRQMLVKADERVGIYQHVTYLQASFEELLRGQKELGHYDLAVSSQAIHHLSLADKAALFGLVHSHLSPGGRLFVIDVVVAPDPSLEDWYRELWKSWMREMQQRLGRTEDLSEDVVRRYDDPKSNNSPDTLEAQLQALRDAGYIEVDCYFKLGIFTAFGGRRPAKGS